MRRTRFVQGRVDAITPTPTPTPTASAPVNSALPSISGTAVKGQTLTASTGSWLNLPTGFAYQWASGGSAIPGATSQTYVLAQSDVGASVTCAVVASNAAGSGSATSAAVGPVLDLAPVNTVAPVLSGTATVGQTLSVTNGTWTNPPTSYSYDWRRNGTSIGAANQNTYGLTVADNGANITCVVTATNSGGSGTATSNSLGPVGTVSLATPTLAIQSTLGTAPLTLQWSDTDYVVGLYAQLQIDQTGNTFSNITQNIVFFIDGTSWATLDESIGLVTPSGTYWARIRALRDNDSGATVVTGNDPLGNAVSFNADASAWSNTVTDTINASSAVLTSISGASCSRLLTVSGGGLAWAVNNGGAEILSRATISSPNGDFYFEAKPTVFAASGQCIIGVTDNSINFDGSSGFFGTGDKFPGDPTFNGFSLILTNGGTAVDVRLSGTSTAITIGGSTAVNDTIGLEYIAASHVFKVFYKLGAGTMAQIGTQQTLTSLIPATPYAFAGGKNTNDAGTINFGASAFALGGTGPNGSPSGSNIYG
jgi:hypothetical protein